jgi:hypothetical protein
VLTEKPGESRWARNLSACWLDAALSVRAVLEAAVVPARSIVVSTVVPRRAWELCKFPPGRAEEARLLSIKNLFTSKSPGA